jgi:hypothetical protein
MSRRRKNITITFSGYALDLLNGLAEKRHVSVTQALATAISREVFITDFLARGTMYFKPDGSDDMRPIEFVE